MATFFFIIASIIWSKWDGSTLPRSSFVNWAVLWEMRRTIDTLVLEHLVPIIFTCFPVLCLQKEKPPVRRITKD